MVKHTGPLRSKLVAIIKTDFTVCRKPQEKTSSIPATLTPRCDPHFESSNISASMTVNWMAWPSALTVLITAFENQGD